MRDGKARVPSKAEIDRLLTVVAAGQYAERNTAMLYISYGAGLRVKEIAAMMLEDVLMEDGSIRRSFTVRKADSKTKKSKEVFLESDKVRKALADYVAHLRARGDVYLNQPLFTSYAGNRMSPNTLQQLFARLYKAAGLNGCKSHSGRRSFATTLLNKGVDIKSVQTMMGHSNINMTAEYADAIPDTLKLAATKAI